MTTHTLAVEVPRDYWMSANRQIPNHAYRRRLISALHELTTAAAHRQRLTAPDGPVIACWTIRYPKGVAAKADPTNAHPVCKAVLDALVPRWLPDDSPQHVVEERYRRGPNLDQPGGHVVVLTLRPAEEDG